MTDEQLDAWCRAVIMKMVEKVDGEGDGRASD